MKRVLYLLLILPFFMYAQQCHKPTASNNEEQSVSDPGAKVDGNVQVATYTNTNNKIKGSPYAFSDWSSGDITTTSNTSIKYDRIQFDLERNQVLVYNKGSEVPTSIPTNEIVSLKANDSKNVRYFASIKPTQFNGSKEDKLYELLSKANDLLIKETTKYVSESNDTSPEGAKKMIYKKKTVYYVKDKSGMYVQTKLNKKHLLKIMKDKEKDVKTFISKNKLSFNEKDTPKILEYYYSLS